MSNLLRMGHGWALSAPRLLFFAALAALFVAGAAARSWGVLVGTLDFWADEAWWAVNLVEQPISLLSIRPVGYFWLCQQLNRLGNPELFLRLPSYLAGVGVLACVAASAALLYRSRLVVLFVLFVAAMHPTLLVFAKEFKPYSFEAFVHSGLILWAMICWRRGRSSVAFWVAAGIALPFCYNVVFLYPALLLALVPGLRRWLKIPEIWNYINSSVERRFLAGFALTAGVACLLIVGSYSFNSHKLFWGAKYDVFALDEGILGTLIWYAGKTWKLVTMPGSMHGVLPAAQTYVQAGFFAAYMLGVAALVRRRRYADLVLLCGPVVLVAFANVIGYWPYGAFRTNLFLIPGALLVSGVGLDVLTSTHGARVAVWAGMFVVVVLSIPASPDYFRWKWISHGAPSPQITEVLDELLIRHGNGDRLARNVIIADWHSWRTLDYYLLHNAKGSTAYLAIRESAELVKGPLNAVPELQRLIEQERRRAVESGLATRVWVVVTKLDSFAGFRESRVVEQYGAYQKDFSTHDETYHPQLTELRFE